MSVSGLSASQMNEYRQAAMGLISKYDQNRDGQLAPQETQQTLNLGSDSYNFTNRLDDSYSQITTVFQNNVSQLNAGTVAMADANHDGQVSADELVQTYLASRDGNHDGKLGFFEKLGTSVNGMLSYFETKSSVETNRSTSTVYDPAVVYTPVIVEPSDPYRPAPPVVYNPYSSGPTPPSPSYRPAPPPVYSGGGGGVRPTPPSSGSRPTPPRVH